METIFAVLIFFRTLSSYLGLPCLYFPALFSHIYHVYIFQHCCLTFAMLIFSSTCCLIFTMLIFSSTLVSHLPCWYFLALFFHIYHDDILQHCSLGNLHLPWFHSAGAERYLLAGIWGGVCSHLHSGIRCCRHFRFKRACRRSHITSGRIDHCRTSSPRGKCRIFNFISQVSKSFYVSHSHSVINHSHWPPRLAFVNPTFEINILFYILHRNSLPAGL